MLVPMFVVCCVGSSLCDVLTTLSEEPYRVCVCVCVCVCLTVCDLETSTMRRPRLELGCRATATKRYYVKIETHCSKRVAQKKTALNFLTNY
jgi:hypothetical protein